MYTVNGMKNVTAVCFFSCYTFIGLCGKRYGKTSSPLTLSQCFICATYSSAGPWGSPCKALPLILIYSILLKLFHQHRMHQLGKVDLVVHQKIKENSRNVLAVKGGGETRNLTGVFDEADLAVLLPYLFTPVPFFLQFHKVLN